MRKNIRNNATNLQFDPYVFNERRNLLQSLCVALLMTDRADNSLSKRCSHQGGDTYG